MLPEASLEDVEGFASASARTSHTTAEGRLRLTPIDGVHYRLARPVSHQHGHLTEVFRTDWDITDFPIVQVKSQASFTAKISSVIIAANIVGAAIFFLAERRRRNSSANFASAPAD